MVLVFSFRYSKNRASQGLMTLKKVMKPLRASSRRTPGSGIFNTFWILAFARMTELRNFLEFVKVSKLPKGRFLNTEHYFIKPAKKYPSSVLPAPDRSLPWTGDPGSGMTDPASNLYLDSADASLRARRSPE